MRVGSDIQCEACDTWCDEDPIKVMNAYPIPKKVVSEQVKADLAWFWLCTMCKEDVTGIDDWYTDEYLTSVPCEDCNKPGSYDDTYEKNLCDDCWSDQENGEDYEYLWSSVVTVDLR